MRRLKRWQKLLIAVIIVLIGLPAVVFLILGLLPVPSDPILPPEAIIVGAQGQADSATGISTTFPPVAAPEANPGTPEKQALGRLLFFDSILSGEKGMACATCHHPDLGLSDGRATGQGRDGQLLARNVPTLYEVAYKTSLFWDGRAESLEAQLLVPMTAEHEMGATPEQVVAALRAIPEYRTLFAQVFPGQDEPITFENVAYAIAAFERGLLAHDSPFDRYAQGDFSALSPSQRRGFALFRSGATGCYHCHAAPTFTNFQFEVTGVPDADGLLRDEGRGAITGEARDRFAFLTPTLRNVALTAPYMHNGRFETLEEVVAFYAQGGGQGLGLEVPNQSRFVNPFELSAQEKQDLVDFLYALTDESARPQIPERVPSGLPVVRAVENPARARVEATNTGGAALTERPPTTLTVTPGVTIQSVVDQALPGDTIEIQYGVYHERVVVDMHDLTLRGLPNAAGEWPVLDGQMKFSDGIAASGNNFTVEQLAVRNYLGNGIIVDGAVGVVLRDLYVENTSLYGVYPVHSTDVLIERVKATAIRDAGVYAGQCRDVIIRHNEVYGNVIGIEVENSIHAEVYANYAYNNATGIFIDLLPQLKSKVSQQTRVYDNRIENNNLKNFALEGEIGALVPEGIGILVLGADDVEIFNNTLRDNRTAGVAIFSTATAFPPEQIDVHPNPERVHLHGNTYSNNGYQPDKQLTDLGISQGADILWDASNWDNRFDDVGATSFPPVLPSSAWPDLTRRAYWQVLNFLITRLL